MKKNIKDNLVIFIGLVSIFLFLTIYIIFFVLPMTILFGSEIIFPLTLFGSFIAIVILFVIFYLFSRSKK
jgi:uncharacterized membrane protein